MTPKFYWRDKFHPNQLAVESLKRALRLSVAKILYVPGNFEDAYIARDDVFQPSDQSANISGHACLRGVNAVGIDANPDHILIVLPENVEETIPCLVLAARLPPRGRDAWGECLH